ncbi:MAG: B12-binding domain-containing radical SAM protein [Nitrospirales bacterium]|nr:B12-binding domain-containing radical SAM protein [Nitrospira sp.]MDR4502360.1 B12-binding domain-containing radical SAM protein [Nitrospirales bacterium]
MIDKVLIVVPPLVNSEGKKDSSHHRPDFESYRLVSPIEPTLVASDLREKGFEVRIVDLGVYTNDRFDHLATIIENFKPDAAVVIQSILTFATAQDWDAKRVFDIAKEQMPDIVTILTGGHASNYPGQAVKEGICQYSIKGEVDFAVSQLLLAINNGSNLSSVAGLSFQYESKVRVSHEYPLVDVSELPLPAYDLLDGDHKLGYSSVLEFGKIRFPERSNQYRDIMTSRSCRLRCSFCSVAHLRGEKQRYRRKPVEKVIHEIEVALEEGIKEIHFFDDLFAETETQILELTNEIMKRNLKFPWFVAQGMPLWPLTHHVLSAMKEAGMYRLICPLESGNDRVLKKVIGKSFSTVQHHHNVIMWAHDLGLEVIGMFVIGMPGETREEILDTLTFAEGHPEIDYSVFSIATPMMGTRLMKAVRKSGQLEDSGKINRIIKRTVALYSTEAFSEYELGVIRAFDWDRINFSSESRRVKYAAMVGVSLQQLEELRTHAKDTFFHFFPNYDGPWSFRELYYQPDLYRSIAPKIA